MEYLNFSWVIHGSLAGAQGPVQNRELVFLKLRDVRAIVRMDSQTISGESAELVDFFEPVPDFTAPSLDQIERIVGFISQQIETWERPVVVTCRAGLGRTGTVLACYLVHEGYSADKAINLVRELRPNSIETGKQEDAVHQYAESLRSKDRESR